MKYYCLTRKEKNSIIRSLDLYVITYISDRSHIPREDITIPTYLKWIQFAISKEHLWTKTHCYFLSDSLAEELTIKLNKKFAFELYKQEFKTLLKFTRNRTNKNAVDP